MRRFLRSLAIAALSSAVFFPPIAAATNQVTLPASPVPRERSLSLTAVVSPGPDLVSPGPDLVSPRRSVPAWRHASLSIGTAPESRSVTTPLALASLAFIPLDGAIHHYTARHWSGSAPDRLSSAGNEAGSIGGIAAVGATYLIGSRHERDTAMMAASAAVDSALITTAMKWIVGRRRPSGGEAPSFSPFHGGESFPSGHTSFSFALAAVYAHRYPRFAPLAYGLASWIGLSRIQSNHHFLSDVLMGAAIGINSGQRAVDGKVSISQWRF